MAKGVLAFSHPLSLGTIGLKSRDLPWFAFEQADGASKTRLPLVRTVFTLLNPACSKLSRNSGMRALSGLMPRRKATYRGMACQVKSLAIDAAGAAASATTRRLPVAKQGLEFTPWRGDETVEPALSRLSCEFDPKCLSHPHNRFEARLCARR